MLTKPGWATQLFRPVESTFQQVPRALVAAGVCAALDMALLVALVEFAGWAPLPAATLGYVAGGVLQYVLCVAWIFPHGPKNAVVGVTTFTALALCGLGITWLTIAALNGGLGMNYTLAKVFALGIAFVWNFLSRKMWVFRAQAEPQPAG